jgi:hypothetical protein
VFIEDDIQTLSTRACEADGLEDAVAATNRNLFFWCTCPYTACALLKWRTLAKLHMIIGSAVALAMALLGWSTIASAQRRDVVDEPEAYSIYASVLPIKFGTGDTDLSRIALLGETRRKLACSEETIQPEWRSVWEDYKKANSRVRALLPRSLTLAVPYQLIPLATVKSLLAKSGFDGKTQRGGWSQAYTTFPNGKLLALSAVGFNDAKTRAVVTVQYNCGMSFDVRSFDYDCHGGLHLALVKQDERWIRAAGRHGLSCVWVS